MGLQAHSGLASNRAETGIKKGNACVSAHKASERIDRRSRGRCQYSEVAEGNACEDIHTITAASDR